MKSISRQPLALLSIATDPSVKRYSVDTNTALYDIHSLAEALAKLGWHVDVFTRKTQPDQPKVVWHSPDHRTIYLEAGATQLINSQQLLEYLPQIVEAFQTFTTKEGMNYPLVHTWDWISGRAGLRLKELSNIRLIHSKLGDVQLMSECELWQKADQILVNRLSDEATACSSPADAKARLGFNSTDRIVLYIGSTAAQSGLDTLVQAFALCHDRFAQNASCCALSHQLRLVLVSNCNQQERQSIEQRLQALQVSERTQFVNPGSPELLPLYYAAADVCVIPSLYEPFGSVALKALTYGIPVVASNVGGLKFVVASEETGLLVPPQDVVTFAEAIDRVLSDELWVRRLKRQASGQLDPSLSSIQIAAQLSDLYRRLLASSISQAGLWDVQKPYVLSIPNAALPTRSVSSMKLGEKKLMYIS